MPTHGATPAREKQKPAGRAIQRRPHQRTDLRAGGKGHGARQIAGHIPAYIARHMQPPIHRADARKRHDAGPHIETAQRITRVVAVIGGAL